MPAEATFLEVVLQAADFTFGGRDEAEDPLDEALQAAGIGEVTGGGTGMGISNIDIEVTDLTAGLAIIRSVLRGLGVARSTVIVRHKPNVVLTRFRGHPEKRRIWVSWSDGSVGRSRGSSRPRRSGWWSREGGRSPEVARDLDLTESALRHVGAPGGGRCGTRQAGRADHGGARGAGATAARGEDPAPRAGDPEKSGGLLREGERVKFAFIHAEKAKLPTSLLCRALRCLGAASTPGASAHRRDETSRTPSWSR